MARFHIAKSVLAFSFAVALTACDSGTSETIEEIIDNEVVNTETTPETPPDTETPETPPETETPDPAPVTGTPETPPEPMGGIDITLPPELEGTDLSTTPVFVTTTCDAAPPQEDVAPGGNASSATTFLMETLVGGRIDPDSLQNNVHYWSIDLQPGIYHLVTENESPDGSVKNFGITIESIDPSADEEVIERLLSAFTGGVSRVRFYDTFTVEEAQTLTLRVTPRSGQEDYLIGVYRNGVAVPSPYFTNCPEIIPLTLDTTQAFRLLANDNSNIGPEVWLQTKLEVGDYELPVTVNAVDPEEAGYIDFELIAYDRFSGHPRMDKLLDIFENPATMYEGTAEYQSSDVKSVWFRFLRGRWDYDITVTLTEQ